ncbi:uncharacterized protein LOC127779280 [Oryza glaberrima]|uniref:uncharacterized protein LOC127779280 n=1 Tax=Oryza glaberrima TaxID=4538 RepID=UPI00224BFF11|nr:uncharacterized protein LOC127779280 [Oryza glaberrima]
MDERDGKRRRWPSLLARSPRAASLLAKVIEWLSADAQRLVDLQSIVGELWGSTEAAPELDDVTAQMVDAESAIAQLIDTNGKLLRKAEEFTSADAFAGDDLRSRSQRKILELVRKMSEKITPREQETQRFQHAQLRHEKDHATRRAAAAASGGKSSAAVQRWSLRVQLGEYLYGRRRDSRRQRRGPSCCMRAKAIDD